MVEMLDSWSVATDKQIKVLLEASSLSDYEHNHLKNLIARVEAFKAPLQAEVTSDDDIPF